MCRRQRVRGSRYVIAPLSNGNVALLVNIAKRAGLPWNLVVSAELVRHYKPDPEAYLMAFELLALEPGQVMMVAAHPDDLRAAGASGLRTAYVPAPLSSGPEEASIPPPSTSSPGTLSSWRSNWARKGG